MTLKRMIKLLKEYLKMNDSELSDVDKYRLNQLNKIKDYFNNEINEGKNIIKKLNKYLVSLDYLDKIFITLSVSFGALSIVSHATVIGIPVGIAGSSLTLIFSISTGINKSFLQATKKRKKKHNKIMVLAKNKLNMIDALLSNALNGFKISHEEFSNIITEKNPKYDGYQRGLASMVYKFFNSKVAPQTVSGKGIKESNNILAEELHKPVIKKINKRKVKFQFKDNIWGVDLADMQSLSKKSNSIKYLLCVIDLFSKYAFAVPLKDKKGASITNAFNKIIKKSNRKPNKIWINQGGEFYNHVFKKLVVK